ncbi:hypothetical protein FN846DRAFT_896473 [Sphaerosporella brunnea]|nr:hypothetical protein FN846DRAFT_896473 [Sphaerosporella brunnea]
MCFQLGAGKLSLGDAVLGSMVLDAQSTALMATVALRDVRSARTHLVFLYVASLLSLIVMSIVLVRVQPNPPFTNVDTNAECPLQTSELKPQAGECPNGYQFWGYVPASSSPWWLYVLFRFLLIIIPAAHKVYDAWYAGAGYANTWRIPFLPMDYLILSLASLLKLANELPVGLSSATTDLQITGQLMALLIGLGTFLRAIWLSFHHGDALFQLMRDIMRHFEGWFLSLGRRMFRWWIRG